MGMGQIARVGHSCAIPSRRLRRAGTRLGGWHSGPDYSWDAARVRRDTPGRNLLARRKQKTGGPVAFVVRKNFGVGVSTCALVSDLESAKQGFGPTTSQHSVGGGRY